MRGTETREIAAKKAGFGSRESYRRAKTVVAPSERRRLASECLFRLTAMLKARTLAGHASI